MKTWTRQELMQLTASGGDLWVSIYMPTDRTGAQAQPDALRLLNLLAEAERKLLGRGVRSQEASDWLAPARQLPRQGGLQEEASDGLALFLSAGHMTYFRLPLNFQEQVIVAPRPHITALLPLLNDVSQLFVLALSQDEVRLIEGTPTTVRQIDLEGVPKNLAEALKFDEPLKQRLFRTIPRTVGRGRQTALYYGQGVGTDDAKERLLRYVQQVAKGVYARLKDERAPLVLACVGYLFPLYTKVNMYPHLWSEFIEGNPERVSAQELYARARQLLQPLAQQAQENAWAKYWGRIGTGLASNQPQEILAAARHGRVETLFLRAGAAVWGVLDEHNDTVALRSESDAEADELLNLAAIQTLQHQGTVYVVEGAKMPDQVNLAAVFRY